MKTADTSAVVAAFASWHENHDAARRALDSDLRLIAHCALESYSVLTRLPPPHRASGALVRQFLESRFPQPFLRLSERAYRNFVFGLPDHELTGGASYDALIGATAANFGFELVTCDRRALPVYERYRVKTHILV